MGTKSIIISKKITGFNINLYVFLSGKSDLIDKFLLPASGQCLSGELLTNMMMD